MKNNTKRIFMALLVIICTITFITPTMARSVRATIDVYYNDIKIYIDGVMKSPDTEPFILDGRVYVPLRFVSEELGKPVTWDSATSSVYIGAMPKGHITYMENMKTLTSSMSFWNQVTKFVSNMGKSYSHGYYISGIGGELKNEYLLNAQYSKFTAVIDISEHWQTQAYNKNIGYFEFYADGVKVYSTGAIPSDITNPYIIEIDLTNVLKFQVVGYGYYNAGRIGIFDAIFIN